MIAMHSLFVADRSLRIETDADVLAARSAVRRCAQELGFPPKDVAELVIVVSELASNILKYAGEGAIAVAATDDPRHGSGVHIAAFDAGPAFHDLSMALRDGYGDRGPILPERMFGRKGIGGGLGAVVRFTDSFECDQQPAGKRIGVVRFRRRPRRSKPAPPR
jgi:anti-sigma regulatory factor (Ser/Thr protein kinase)